MVGILERRFGEFNTHRVNERQGKQREVKKNLLDKCEQMDSGTNTTKRGCKKQQKTGICKML